MVSWNKTQWFGGIDIFQDWAVELVKCGAVYWLHLNYFPSSAQMIQREKAHSSLGGGGILEHSLLCNLSEVW